MLQFDEEASRQLEAAYVTPDVVEQRRVVVDALGLSPGEDALDIGSGPGLLACDLAAALGPAGSVVGIDPSESMLALSARRELAPDAAPVSFLTGDACALPFDDASFDVAVSTQVYEYVEDIAGALAEAHRVLRPGGRLLVLDTDWDSVVWHSSDPERMRRVLAVWDAHLADPYLPRRLGRLLADAGFVVTRRQAVPILNAGYDPSTFSANLVAFISRFLAGREDIAEAEASAWAEDLVALGDDYFFSFSRYLFVGEK
ncbi:MAG TPA: methyltransferase domain-containing protein [Solirubrobacteraceae bacterium]